MREVGRLLNIERALWELQAKLDRYSESYCRIYRDCSFMTILIEGNRAIIGTAHFTRISFAIHLLTT